MVAGVQRGREIREIRKIRETKKKMKTKKTKLIPIPKIHKQLFKLWSLKVRNLANNTCEYCNATNVPLDAHHLISRKIKDSALKWDVNNGICLCKGKCHKFGNNSFHKNPIVTMDWLRLHQEYKYYYCLSNSSLRIDQTNRSILTKIKEKLNAS